MMLSTATPGTQIKFTPVNGNDTMVKNGVSKEITTKLMCITAMQQYQSKSLEVCFWARFLRNNFHISGIAR
jgi:nuclear pore complex protein Nup98-Nup96